MQSVHTFKKGYKSVKLGLPFLHLEIPMEWTLEKLNNFVFDIRGGASLEPKDFTKDGFPVLHKGDIKPNDVIEIGDTNPYCSKIFAEKEKKSIIDKTFLVVTLRDLVPTGPNIGLIAHSQGTYLLAQGAYGFRCDMNKINSKYLVQVSNSDFYRRYMKGISVGSTQIHIRTPVFFGITLPIPTIKEQQKIASILSNVDELIQKTKQIIEQTQRLKKGLMQRLLTKGIGHIKFKKVELGIPFLKIEIPEDWQIKTLNEVTYDIRGGAPLEPSDFTSSGFPVLHKGDIKPNDTIEISEINPFCSEKFMFNHKNSIIDNSFLVVTLRDLVPDGPAIGLIAKSNGTYLLAQGAYGFHYDTSKINADFLIHLSNSNFYRKYMRSISVGSTQIHIRTNKFFDIKIPFPPIEEQKMISMIINNINISIKKLQKKQELLEYIKKGLMQQLLTGTIRVKV